MSGYTADTLPQHLALVHFIQLLNKPFDRANLLVRLQDTFNQAIGSHPLASPFTLNQP